MRQGLHLIIIKTIQLRWVKYQIITMRDIRKSFKLFFFWGVVPLMVNWVVNPEPEDAPKSVFFCNGSERGSNGTL
jgi:hypothetical protein